MHEFITVPEAVDILRITEASVRRAIQRGEIIGGKLGGRYIASKQSVEAYKPREYRSGASEEMGDLRLRIEQIKNNLGLEYADSNPRVQKLLISSRLGNHNEPDGNYFQILLKPGEWDITEGFPKCKFCVEDYDTFTDDVIEQQIKNWVQEVQQGGFLKDRTTLDR